MRYVIKSVIVRGQEFSIGDTMKRKSDGSIVEIGKLETTYGNRFVLFTPKGMNKRHRRAIDTHEKVN